MELRLGETIWKQIESHSTMRFFKYLDNVLPEYVLREMGAVEVKEDEPLCKTCHKKRGSALSSCGQCRFEEDELVIPEKIVTTAWVDRLLSGTDMGNLMLKIVDNQNQIIDSLSVIKEKMRV